MCHRESQQTNFSRLMRGLPLGNCDSPWGGIFLFLCEHQPPNPMSAQTATRTEKKLHVWYDIIRPGQALQRNYFIVGPNYDDEQQLRDAALKEWAKIGSPPIWRAAIITTTGEEIKL